MKRNALSALALAAMLAAPPTQAGTQVGEYLTFSGFGTLGVVKTDSDEGKFMRDGQKTGATTKASADVDSNLGLQMDAKLTDFLSVTLQQLYQQRDHAHLERITEWGFVKFEPLSSLAIRVGRTSPTMFAVSDYRNVGYVNSWLRPPDEVYGLALLHKLDGFDVTWNGKVGPGKLSTMAAKGKSSVFAPGAAVPLKVTDSTGLNVVYEMDGITLRLGQTKADVAITAQAGGGVDLYTFSGAGVIVDRNNIVAQAEYVTRDSSRFGRFIDAKGYYVLGGYRFGNWLPYATLAKTWPGTPGGVVGRQKTNALGVRWDAFKSTAIKLQAEHVETDGTRGVSFVTPLLPTGRGNLPVTKPVNALSVAVDFVF